MDSALGPNDMAVPLKTWGVCPLGASQDMRKSIFFGSSQWEPATALITDPLTTTWDTSP